MCGASGYKSSTVVLHLTAVAPLLPAFQKKLFALLVKLGLYRELVQAVTCYAAPYQSFAQNYIAIARKKLAYSRLTVWRSLICMAIV